MGITGLLPFLEKKKASRPCSIKEFSGCTVAADAYCWLHKGAFACAEKLARGEPTDMYVQYCMKYVNMLLSHNIKPILVFDGRHLPAKAETERKRREKRKENKSQAAALLRQGRAAEARTFLQRCIDVTHAMALAVMKECHKLNVDCIVAPHEADAQLAFFNLEGIAQLVITEDSDLLLFGCKKVMFKLDLAGNGILVEEEKLKLSMGVRPENYSFDKFRYMCILSGCDYLESLPGIGLTKACQFISRSQDPDIHKALSRLPFQLNMRGLNVSSEYRDAFIKADAMFRHQLVFDPRIRKVKPLTPYTPVQPTSPLAGGPLPGCKPELEDSIAFELALGNIDPSTMEKVYSFDPDAQKSEGSKTQYYGQSLDEGKPSIWSSAFYNEECKKPTVKPSFMEVHSRPVESTNGKTKSFNVDILKKRKRPVDENLCSDLPDDKRQTREESKLLAFYSSPKVSDLLSVYISPSPVDSRPSGKLSPEKSPHAGQTSPILTPKSGVKNPFAQRNSAENKKNLGGNPAFILHSLDLETTNVQSKYFNKTAKKESGLSPTGKEKKSPSKNDSPITLNRNRSPVKQPDQMLDAECSPEFSPDTENKDLSVKEVAPQSPAKSTVIIINDDAVAAPTVPNSNVENKLQIDFISTLAKRVKQGNVLKSPPDQRKANFKGDEGKSFGRKVSPKLGSGVKRQGLLSCYGFVAKTKLEKS